MDEWKALRFRYYKGFETGVQLLARWEAEQRAPDWIQTEIKRALTDIQPCIEANTKDRNHSSLMHWCGFRDALVSLSTVELPALPQPTD